MALGRIADRLQAIQILAVEKRFGIGPGFGSFVFQCGRAHASDVAGFRAVRFGAGELAVGGREFPGIVRAEMKDQVIALEFVVLDLINVAARGLKPDFVVFGPFRFDAEPIGTHAGSQSVTSKSQRPMKPLPLSFARAGRLKAAESQTNQNFRMLADII